jgi:preprotein translocase subunit Sec61beta
VPGELPEVIRLTDARGERPANAAGIGEFWYEPEVWALPLSPDARVLYAGLCSFLGHREINRKDLRNTLKDRPDEGISSAIEELARHGLLAPDADSRGYEVRPVREFMG